MLSLYIKASRSSQVADTLNMKVTLNLKRGRWW